jgi:hypothetical protein
MEKILAFLFAALLCLGLAGMASADPPVCASPAPGAPIFVTEDCVDPVLNNPVVDLDEWRQMPVPHRYVNGHFEGTGTRFSFYFPPQEKYEGRFFHYVLPAPSSVPGAENTAENNIQFGSASGAYYVQTNGGGTLPGTPGTINGYRADAATAKFSRVLAAAMYGNHRPYGYRYGGSGGSYKTISGAENTSGVWDGTVPFVMPTPMAIPNTYSVRANALRVLRRGDKCPALVDAIEPGGGDMYAGLNQEERGALTEATRFGFPPRGWYTCKEMNVGALPLVFYSVAFLDPTYFTDFWTLPGYLGTDPTSSVRDDRVQFETVVTEVITNPPSDTVSLPTSSVRLASVPDHGDLTYFNLTVLSGDAAGNTLPMGGDVPGLVGNVATFEPYTANPAVVAKIRVGDQVRIDNLNFLALQTYHRHQVPTPDRYIWGPDPGFYVFDQFLKPDGTPLYPQRPILIGPLSTGTGTVQNGCIHGKMIVFQTLMDIDALPWMADWYRTKVQKYLGKDLDRQYRLYYIDNADHGSEVGAALPGQIVDPGRLPTHIVRYRPVIEQLLRDLSAWVERGVKPPASTLYKVIDGLPVVPDDAGKRKGIQPVVHLWANGRERAEVKVGEPVFFSAHIQVPPGAGKVVAAEWDFKGEGNFPDAAHIGHIRPEVHLWATYTFSEPGTYFPVLRATSQREGDPDTPWARIENLDRVRVVVTPRHFHHRGHREHGK